MFGGRRVIVVIVDADEDNKDVDLKNCSFQRAFRCDDHKSKSLSQCSRVFYLAEQIVNLISSLRLELFGTKLQERRV